MKKRFAILTTIGAAAVVLALDLPAISDAATTGVDLGITGSVVAGVVAGQPGQELAFTFTVKNHSTTTAADLEFDFSYTNATANGTDYICTLISNHYDINPDTPACETGTLAHGKTASAAILLTPTGTGTVTAKACAVNESGATDPVPGNNCKTLSVRMA